MAEASLKLGDGSWATKKDSLLGFNDQNGNYKPIPFDFTRATTATRVNRDGLIEEVQSGVPRIDFTDSDGSLLLEPQRTNLVTYSEDISQWANTEVSLETGHSAPDGSTNAYKITDNSTNSLHRILDTTATTPSSGDFIYSIFLKKGTMTDAVLNLYSNGTKAVATVDLDSGTIVASGGGVNAKIEDYGNDWYRCSVGGTFGSSSTTVYLYLSDTKNPYIGNDEFLYAWGAQLEEGSYPTSYIKTSGSAVTRNADVSYASNQFEQIGQTEGTIYAEFVLDENASGHRLSLSDNTTSNWIFVSIPAIYGNGNETRMYVRIGASTLIDSQTNADVFNEGQVNKVAFAYKSGDTRVYVNGTSVLSSSTTFGSPTSDLDVFVLTGASATGSVSLMGMTNNINQTLLFKTRLSNDELAALTTL